tara:strand:- start:208 stop:1806 length:1599 start_codon:yes stop_codon:yes gene_type:complete
MKKDDITILRDSVGLITSDSSNVENVQTLLNSTGCGFCLAKFTQVTMHLGTGFVHSCHHPKPHKISVEEIEKDYRALFNTSHLKQVRKEMLNNQKPSECDYCWRIEDDGNISDRSFKSIKSWALDHHDEISQYKGDEIISPTYLEVSFSNVCNMSCLYCGPEFSSKWVEDLKQKGPMKVLEGLGKKERWVQGWQDLDNLNIPNREYNPYINAFWKWFPEVYPKLKTYRITGGEPLMSKETFRSMDWLAANPNPGLDFSINTNLNVPDKLWNTFIEKLVKIKDTMGITVFTSIEAWGKRAEYLRRGLDFDVFKKRYEQLAQLGNVKVVIMAAYNVLSISSFQQFLEWQLEMKQTYNYNGAACLHWEKNTSYKFREGMTNIELKKRSPSHVVPLGLDIPYLRHPKFLDAQICSDTLVQDYMIPTMNFMANNTVDNKWAMHSGFELNEMYKLKSITEHRLKVSQSATENLDTYDHYNKITIPRAELYDFLNRKDERDGTNFLETFPEMAEFYEECRLAKEIVKSKYKIITVDNVV